jgi:hypothetical protein
MIWPNPICDISMDRYAQKRVMRQPKAKALPFTAAALSPYGTQLLFRNCRIASMYTCVCACTTTHVASRRHSYDSRRSAVACNRLPSLSRCLQSPAVAQPSPAIACRRSAVACNHLPSLSRRLQSPAVACRCFHLNSLSPQRRHPRGWSPRLRPRHESCLTATDPASASALACHFTVSCVNAQERYAYSAC